MKTLNCLQVPNDPSCQVLLTSNIMIFKSFSTLNLPQYNKEFFYNWENTISMTGQYLSATNTLNGLCKELQVFFGSGEKSISFWLWSNRCCGPTLFLATLAVSIVLNQLNIKSLLVWLLLVVVIISCNHSAFFSAYEWQNTALLTLIAM